jgi:UDP-glucose 4-epimerase
MVGRPTVGVPHFLAPALAGVFRQARVSDFSADQIDALTYGRGMDTSRFVQATGFRPAFSSRQALAEFAAAHPGPLAAERVEPLLDSLAARLRRSTPGDEAVADPAADVASDRGWTRG